MLLRFFEAPSWEIRKCPVLLSLLLTLSSFGQQQSGQAKPADEGDKGLQNAVQNPVASLISVPFQDNSIDLSRRFVGLPRFARNEAVFSATFPSI